MLYCLIKHWILWDRIKRNVSQTKRRIVSVPWEWRVEILLASFTHCQAQRWWVMKVSIRNLCWVLHIIAWVFVWNLPCWFDELCLTEVVTEYEECSLSSGIAYFLYFPPKYSKFCNRKDMEGNQFKVTCDPLLSCNLFPSFAVNTPSDFNLLFSNGAHYLNHFHLAF